MPLFINNKEVTDKDDKNKILQFIERSSMFRKASWLDKVPRFKEALFRIGIALKLIRRYQWFEFTVYEGEPGSRVLKRIRRLNAVVDAGTQQLGNLMIAANTNTLNNVNIGTSNAATTNGMTDLTSPAAGSGRQASTSRTISGAAPFIITISAFIGAGVYTRPVTVQEIAVFFDPNVGGAMFARSVISSTVLGVGNTATLAYGILLG